jgi:hypothetical protein
MPMLPSTCSRHTPTAVCCLLVCVMSFHVIQSHATRPGRSFAHRFLRVPTSFEEGCFFPLPPSLLSLPQSLLSLRWCEPTAASGSVSLSASSSAEEEDASAACDSLRASASCCRSVSAGTAGASAAGHAVENPGSGRARRWNGRKMARNVAIPGGGFGPGCDLGLGSGLGSGLVAKSAAAPARADSIRKMPG